VIQENISISGRIYSIDALRGVTLFGILLVHICGFFGFFEYTKLLTNDGIILHDGILFLLSQRCAPVFSMLFGVSFFLILKKPTYTSRKFLWRCVLLIGIGLMNKLFYTYDALLWYGIWGIVLLLFRYATSKSLLIFAILFFNLSLFLSSYNIGNQLLPIISNCSRYEIAEGILFSPLDYSLAESVKDYVRIGLNSGIFGTLSFFLIGYWFAKKGGITNVEKYARLNNVVILGSLYLILYLMYYLLKFCVGIKISILYSYGNLFGALFMAFLFLLIYYKKPSSFKFLESYGKLGLTNYTLQSLFGVLSMILIIIPNKWDMPAILIYFLLFYGIQCYLSYLWLHYFTNGPMEWLWRCATNLKFTSPLKLINK